MTLTNVTRAVREHVADNLAYWAEQRALMRDELGQFAQDCGMFLSLILFLGMTIGLIKLIWCLL